MSLVERLVHILDNRKYATLTFSLRGIPIVTAIFGKDKDVMIITNNMKELRYNVVLYSGDVNNFVKEIENILVYSGIDELIRKYRGVSIEIDSEPYLSGEISENKITIEQVDTDYNDIDGEVTISKRYGITAVVEIKVKTLAEVIGAFAYLRFT